MNTSPADPNDDAFERRLAAVTRAVEDYHSYLLDYLHRLTRQYQDAENLLQDLWRHVLLNFDEEKIHALPLLRRKAYQLFVDHYRRQVRRGEVLAEELPEVPVAATSFTDESEAGEKALQEKFWSEYPTVALTGPQKEVLWLHARYGLTYKEIEARLGIASSTVGDWIILGRKQLAAAINTETK